ncbi:complexed with cef1p [Chamberlinius hualienensis]
MTTAARPTFDPARGKNDKDLSSLSKQYSSRDLPSHLKLKYRQPGQDTSGEIRNRDFRKDLEDREKVASKERLTDREKRSDRQARESHSSNPTKKLRLDQIPTANLDADDPLDGDDDEDDSDDSEDEDDTAELMAELNRIKKERAVEQATKMAEKKVEDERIRMENILSGNPLLNQSRSTDFKVKRRWDDDVVFKNCARGEPDNSEKRFINDSLRSEFHKKFMDKYIK